MSTIKKLIDKAVENPHNLLFKEFCTLCEHFQMVKRKSKGSHIIYKRKVKPIFTLTIQNADGKAKAYQVKQLFDKLKEFGIYNFEER